MLIFFTHYCFDSGAVKGPGVTNSSVKLAKYLLCQIFLAPPVLPTVSFASICYREYHSKDPDVINLSVNVDTMIQMSDWHCCKGSLSHVSTIGQEIGTPADRRR